LLVTIEYQRENGDGEGKANDGEVSGKRVLKKRRRHREGGMGKRSRPMRRRLQKKAAVAKEKYEEENKTLAVEKDPKVKKRILKAMEYQEARHQSCFPQRCCHLLGPKRLAE